MNKLNMLMFEIDHILALISECAKVNDENAKRLSCLQTLFQEKVKTAVALRIELSEQSEHPIEHENNHG